MDVAEGLVRPPYGVVIVGTGLDEHFSGVTSGRNSGTNWSHRSLDSVELYGGVRNRRPKVNNGVFIVRKVGHETTDAWNA